MIPASSQQALLARADLFLLIADLLRRPSSLRQVRWREARAVLQDLIACAGLSDAVAVAIGDALLAASVATPACWSDEYHRLFEGVMLCPPNETAYVRRDKGAIIGDIGGFYLAFGFRSREGAGEKPDHIVSQLEFLAVLLVMQANAAGDAEREGIVEEALRAFAESHLGEWVIPFTQRLQDTSELEIYQHIARAVRASLLALATGYGLNIVPVQIGLPEPEPQEPYDKCGMDQAGSPVPLTIHGFPVATGPLH